MNTNIIDYTYFDGPLILGQMNDADNRKAIESYITYFQPHYLIGVLGYTLGGAFIKALELEATGGTAGGFGGGFDDGFENGSVTPDMARFSFIRDGITYPYNGGQIRWNGLRNDQKLSPLAQFVYYQYQQANYTQTMGVGEVKAVSENAQSAAPTHKQVRAWNDQVDQNKILFGMVSTLKLPATPGAEPTLVFPDLVYSECNPSFFIEINQFNI